jgi:hypothetical protein
MAVLVIILYPVLLPTSAHGQQQQQQDLFPFSFPTLTTSTMQIDMTSRKFPIMVWMLTTHTMTLKYLRNLFNW